MGWALCARQSASGVIPFPRRKASLPTCPSQSTVRFGGSPFSLSMNLMTHVPRRFSFLFSHATYSSKLHAIIVPLTRMYASAPLGRSALPMRRLVRCAVIATLNQFGETRRLKEKIEVSSPRSIVLAPKERGSLDGADCFREVGDGVLPDERDELSTPLWRELGFREADAASRVVPGVEYFLRCQRWFACRFIQNRNWGGDFVRNL